MVIPKSSYIELRPKRNLLAGFSLRLGLPYWDLQAGFRSLNIIIYKQSQEWTNSATRSNR